MFQNKNTVDKYFMDNWGITPIAYDMDNFTAPSNGKWISIQLLPYDRELIGLSPQHGRKLDYGIIRVRTYDVSATKSYLLAFEAQAFLECKQLDNGDGTQLDVDMGVGDGEGAVDLENGIFETTINFLVKKYN
jgi:hypothetical protein